MSRKTSSPITTAPQPVLLLVIAWAVVGLPLLWGIYETFKKALALFVG